MILPTSTTDIAIAIPAAVPIARELDTAEASGSLRQNSREAVQEESPDVYALSGAHVLVSPGLCALLSALHLGL